MRWRITIIVLCTLSIPCIAQEADSAYLHLSETTMYYEKHGEGPPLLLLHGWTQTSDFWGDFLPEFSKNYTTYVVDLRGHGKSGILDDSFSIQAASLDVIEMMDQLGLETVRAIGLSFGAILLLESASRNPGRFESLVLIGAVYDFDGKESGSAIDWRELPTPFVENLMKFHPEGDAQLDRLFDPELNYRVKLGENELGRIYSPTLVVSGDHDEVAGIEQATQIFRMLPDASLWIIPNQGHIPVDDRNRSGFIQQINLFFLQNEFVH